MTTSLDCILCLLRQVLEAAKLTTSDLYVQEEILRYALLHGSRDGHEKISPDLWSGVSSPAFAHNRRARSISFGNVRKRVDSVFSAVHKPFVQDGHGMLPLLSYSFKDSVKVKAFNFSFGVIFGLILFAFGL